LVIAALAAGLVCAVASGGPVRTFTLGQLYDEADVVAVGRVAAQASFWNDAGDTIYTEHEVEVERVLKGLPLDVLRVRQMGGKVGDVELTVAGTAPIETGERVLVFVRDLGEYQALVGMSQGKWSVRSIAGCDHVFRGAAPLHPGPVPGEIPLAELLGKIDAERAAAGGGK
jgi:hypothetical protein